MKESSPMPTGIIAWFAQNSVAANLLMLGVIIIGLFSISSLRKEAFPSLDPDIVTVSVVYDSGDPAQAEEGLALKIEEALETVSGIKTITSTSNSSGSSVSIEKETDYDLDELFDDVQIEIDALNDLPAEAENPIVSKATRQEHALWVQLYGDADRATLQDLAELLKADLLGQSAIRDLTVNATLDPMISVEVDEKTLQAYDLTLTDISDAINNSSGTSISTSLRNGEKTVRLKASEQAYEIEEFKAIPILTPSTGSQILLGDIATVTDTFEDDTFSLSRYNQQNAMAIELVMDEHSDVINVVSQAEEVVAKWKASNTLPENVEIDTWYDQSVLIKDRLSLLIENMIMGIALVFVVLALFLNIKVAFWVSASLPFVFCGTLFFMTDSFVGLTINEMTTFGFIMALGIIVDDAVVIGESVYTTRQAEGDTIKSTILGTHKVAAPTIFGVLTTAVAFLSISMIDGKLGEIYAQFATVVTICLLLSLVESKLILPSHLAHVDTRKPTKKNPLNVIQQIATDSLDWFNQNVYKRIITLALNFRYAVVMIFIALFILVVGMPFSGAVRVAFFPSIESDTVNASISMYNDVSFGQTQESLLALEENALLVDQKLREKYGQAASDEPSITSVQVLADEDSSGTVAIEISEDALYSSGEFATEWTAMSEGMEGVKKLKILSMQELVESFRAELKANDEELLFEAANLLKDKLQTIEGVSGIDDNLDLGEPQYRFELTAQGRALGMDEATLAEQVLQSFGGDTVQSYQRGKDEVSVSVRYPEEDRQTLEDIKSANVRTTDGTIVPLTSVANVLSDYQESEITRIDNYRAVYISATVDQDIIASNELVTQLQNSIVKEINATYPTVTIEFSGEAEQQQESTDSMKSTFIFALIMIFALLAIPLKSYVQPLIIMVAIPFGIVGAILGHWLNDLTVSILSLNGILALSGVVVNDSLLLVSRFNELVKEGAMSVKEAIREACQGRLRAVLLTSITTFAGLAPLLGETSTQAQFLIPAAAALGYGILFATVITLILTPSMLMIQEDVKALGAKIKHKAMNVTLLPKTLEK
ncbi:efflux RND transporter permease subunit [Marinomonas sp. 2405UD66-6]|uniref:efflux RND transporter permease subunit n=1 Tax=Marinomonas sp. 2405UD66-6 TaxID=3391834 RepID=UPI0039C8F2AD